MTNLDLESRTSALKEQIDARIDELDAVMRTYEQAELKSSGNPALNLHLASIYKGLASLYNSWAALGVGKEDVSDLTAIADYYGREVRSQLKGLINLDNYVQEKVHLVGMLPDLLKHFSFLELNAKAAEISAGAVKSAYGLKEEVLQNQRTHRLDANHARLLAKAIVKVAKISDYDSDYGFGIVQPESSAPKKVRITKMKKGDYLGMLNAQEENIRHSLAAVNGNWIREIPYQVQLQVLSQRRAYAEELPEDSLLSAPGGKVIEAEVKTDFTQDRKYAFFIDTLLRNPELRKSSSALASEYERAKELCLVSPPSFSLNSEVYEEVKKEIPFLAYLDNPEAFQELLDTAKGKDEARKIYDLLAGK